jgi:predicted metalloprotease with PDZ domain
MILEVAQDGPAAMASLMAGDLLIGTGDRGWDSIDDFEKALDDAGNRLIRLQFLRGHRTNVRTVAVQLRPRTTVAA